MQLDKGYLQVDGKIMKPGGNLVITKAAVEPVWYLQELLSAMTLQNHSCFARKECDGLLRINAEYVVLVFHKLS